MNYISKFYKNNAKICFNCGQTEGELNLHHIIPKNQGGANEEKNLICLCYTCHKDYHRRYKNMNKHEEQIKEFLQSPSVWEKEFTTKFMQYYFKNIYFDNEIKDIKKKEILNILLKMIQIKKQIKDSTIKEFNNRR